ncbi:hypothetical protein [Streptomyces olivochromogenes]|uniref:hypothetical protein n=1 Tax=Streptomyces olivochromogenes TaxID=1963 RepID=UPI001F40A7E3|nr:hypothetical protein [Streptomyces olivochromogenes]MCF3129897.1 hypothetical protein [Streptomyces olivochromogenes]
MSTTPQMSHQQQQFPTTSPYQQPYGTVGSLEQLQQLGQQQPYQQLLQQLGQPQLGQPQIGQPQIGQPQFGQPQFGQPQGQGEQQIQQMQQIQQIQQQMQHQMQQVTQAAIQQASAQLLQAGIANGYVDIVQPLPGQPQQIFLRFPDGFRVLNNPTPQAHQDIQQAFAVGHQVIGVWDGTSPAVLRSVRVQRL